MSDNSEPLEALAEAGLPSRYQLDGYLGRGGMGVVYSARQTDLDRPVAIKVLSRSLAKNETIVERFLREARIAATVVHPSVVTVHDIGRLGDGRPYLVMERIQGENLSQLLHRRGTMDLPEICRLLGDVAAALDLMHARGIVHRDIKPENLMVVRDDQGQERVKVLDFGIALLTDPEAPRLTASGNLTGTPLYVAPEAALGEPIDGRADVYSLGVVAYLLLSGHTPFESENTVVILSKKISEDPPPLSAYGVLVAEEVERALRQALAREAQDRPPTAGAFLKLLQGAALAPTPAGLLVATDLTEARSSAPPSVPAPTSTPSRSRRWIWVGGLLWGAAVLIGVGGALLGRRGPEVAVVSSAQQPEIPPAPATPAASPPSAEAQTDQSPAPSATSTALPSPTAAAIAPSSAPRPTASPRAAEAKARPRETARPSEHSRPSEAPRPTEAPRPSAVAEPGGAKAGPGALATAESATKRGLRALIRGELTAAVTSFSEATKLAPEQATAWRGLGQAYEGLGQKREAAAAYERYLAIGKGEDPALLAEIKSRLLALRK